MPLNTQPPADGREIFAAGFPGLGGTPSWQLSNGIVSNASARPKGIVDSSLDVSRGQHTAPVDPGSSGSPLLVRGEDGKYRVIGINTYKATARENTNFAIPAKRIEVFVAARLNRREQLGGQEALRERAAILQTEQGEWRLCELDDFKVRTSGRSGVATSFGYSKSFYVGFASPLHSGLYDVCLGYDRTLKAFITYGMAFSYGYAPTPSELEFLREKALGVAFSIGGQMPLRLAQSILSRTYGPLRASCLAKDLGSIAEAARAWRSPTR